MLITICVLCAFMSFVLFCAVNMSGRITRLEEKQREYEKEKEYSGKGK